MNLIKNVDLLDLVTVSSIREMSESKYSQSDPSFVSPQDFRVVSVSFITVLPFCAVRILFSSVSVVSTGDRLLVQDALRNNCSCRR